MEDFATERENEITVFDGDKSYDSVNMENDSTKGKKEVQDLAESEKGITILGDDESYNALGNIEGDATEKKNEIQNISHEEFYAEFVKSASGFVSPELQEKLRNTKLLVAGCGSIGNPVSMLAVRSGMEHITVADPDVVEVTNLPRQEYTFNEVGMNKAHMTAINMMTVNPYARDTLKSIPEGVTDENVENLVANSDIIIDGIDIRATDIMFKLHEFAAQYRKPVITAYDLAGTAMVSVYRYDLKEMTPLDGDMKKGTIEVFKVVKDGYKSGKITEAVFLDYINSALAGGAINPFNVPVEQYEQLVHKEENTTFTPQLGTTARLVSALTMETIKNVLNGDEVKEVIAIDLPSSVRKHNPSILRKVALMLETLKVIKSRAMKVKETLKRNKLI